MTSKTSVQPPGSNATKDDHDHKGGQSSVRDPEMTRCGFKEHVAGSVKTSRKVTTIRVFENLKQGWMFFFCFF